MSEEEYYQWGEIINKNQVTLDDLRELAIAINEYPFANFIGFQRNGTEEAVIFDIEVELPQYPPVDIKRIERIAIVFSPNSMLMPQFLALRKDFPADTLHQNLVGKNKPKSLCLFEEGYQEAKSRITSKMLLYRVGDWLSRASTEQLHLIDQPVEPLLLTSDCIIFDPKIFESSNTLKRELVLCAYSDSPLLLRAFGAEEIPVNITKKPIIPFFIKAAPWHSRFIEYNPKNFEQLAELFNRLNIELISEVSRFISEILKAPRHQEDLKKKIIILLQLPKTRFENDSTIALEYWSFLLSATIEELAIKLGLIGKAGGNIGVWLGEPEVVDLDSIDVLPLKPILDLNEQLANLLSGNHEENKEIVVVGAGALGSQVVLNLARQGFGRWHIVDPDIIFPHNLSRHAMFRSHEGLNKARVLSFEVNSLLNSTEFSKYYPVSILEVLDGNNYPTLRDVLSNKCFVIDLSTSRAVSRYLVDKIDKIQKMCAFIASGGRHLIILHEDKDVRVNLEDLNFQLAEQIVKEPEKWEGIYADINNVNYSSGSCRDISVQLPQDTLAIFSGILSKFIKKGVVSSNPKILVYSLNDDLGVASNDLHVYGVREYSLKKWNIRISEKAINDMKQYRFSHLPNETGGILIGGFDIPRKIIYISLVLPSPQGSVEYPNSYIRGAKGLKKEIENLSLLSGKELSYIGEWHSHPEGYGNKPSKLDKVAHKILSEQMDVDGLPSLMLIIGDGDEPAVLI